MKDATNDKPLVPLRVKDAAGAFFYAVLAILIAQVVFSLVMAAVFGKGATDKLNASFGANIIVSALEEVFLLAAVTVWLRVRGRKNPFRAVKLGAFHGAGLAAGKDAGNSNNVCSAGYQTGNREQACGNAAYEIGKSAKNTVLSIAFAVILSALAIGAFMYMSSAADALFQLMGNSVAMPGALHFFAPGKLIVGLICTAALPAFIEELAFRGAVLQGLKKLGYWPAVLISAAAFSLFHMNPVQTVYQFLLGIVLAIAVLETGSLWAGVIIHFLNNAFVIIADFIAKNPNNPAYDWKTFWKFSGLAGVTFIAGSAIIIGAVLLYRKISKDKCTMYNVQCTNEDKMSLRGEQSATSQSKPEVSLRAEAFAEASQSQPNDEAACNRHQVSDSGQSKGIRAALISFFRPGRGKLGLAMAAENNTTFYMLAAAVIAAAMWIYIFIRGFVA